MIKNIQEFAPRFVPKYLLSELSNLWHLSRVRCHSRYERMLWASKEFNKVHPEIVSTAAYKDLDAWLSFNL